MRPAPRLRSPRRIPWVFFFGGCGLFLVILQAGVFQQLLLKKEMIARLPFLERDWERGWRNRRNFQGFFPSDPKSPYRILYETDPEGQRIDFSVPKEGPVPPKKTLWIFGDSSAFGLGVERRFVFSGRLKKALFAQGVEIKNFSVTGYNSSQVRRTFFLKLKQEAFKPDLLILWVGFNDTKYTHRMFWRTPFLGILSYLQYLHHMSDVLRESRKKGIKVILVTYPCKEEYPQLNRINHWIRSQESSRRNVLVVDVQKEFHKTKEKSLYAPFDDTLQFHFHPSRKGHALAYRLLLPVVTDLLSLNQPGYQRIRVPCLEKPLVVFPAVYSAGLGYDSLALCSEIKALGEGGDVLDIGTGSGIQALSALQKGARRVIATDLSPQAVRNARFNAKLRGWSHKMDVRLVPPDRPDAYSVIRPEERFDLIVSNPPFFDGLPQSVVDQAYFDPGHALVRSLFEGLRRHLKPEGRLLLAFWSGSGLDFLKGLAAQYGLEIQVAARYQKLPPRFTQWLLKRGTKDRVGGRESIIVLEVRPDVKSGVFGTGPD